MKLLFKYLLVLLPFIALAQKEPSAYIVKYDKFNNGKKVAAKTQIIYDNQIAYLSESKDKIKSYTNFKSKENINTIYYKNEYYKNIIAFSKLPKPRFEDKNETILGFSCKYAVFSYFSNKIEVWYTEEAQAKGSPYSNYIPNNNALVLKIVINNSRKIIASAIEKLTDQKIPEYLVDKAQGATKAEFEELKIKSRYTILPIFKDEIINFNPKLLLPQEKVLKTNHTYHFSKGSVVMKKIKLTEELKASGKVFAKLTCKSNGDAYDRTGSVFIIPVEEGVVSMLTALRKGIGEVPVFTDKTGGEYQGFSKESNYSPPIEIVRFFSSFGVHYFNNLRAINNYDWKDNAEYKQEVTALIPNDKEEIWIGVFVGNYDKGGHKISLELDFYPSFEKKEKEKKFIQPLFSSVNIMEMSGQNYGRLFKTDTLKVNFELANNVENLQLLYTTTGHGGWGAGDEFMPRMNHVLVDGKEVFKIVPWRSDCGTYRLSNPASGNFGNGLSSSDLSRSNWCPGTLTPPYIIPLTKLIQGEHTVEIVIEQGDDVPGGSNAWSVTGVLVGNIKSK